MEVSGKLAIIDYFGEHRTVLNDLSESSVGDYVYAQGGIVVQKIPERDALLILEEWRSRFFSLKELDEKNAAESNFDAENEEFKNIIEKAEKGTFLSRQELIQLMKSDEQEQKLLFSAANRLRQKRLKNSCCVHGIIEFSNYCSNNCFYCGIRLDNKKLPRYRMAADEIVAIADHAVNQLGFKALVLQSGEDPAYSTEDFVEIIRRIRERCGVLLFMSVGGRSMECYDQMYQAGARGILMRFETSNPFLHRKIHYGPKSDFDERIRLLKYASELGYIVATGALVGLPGQTEEDIVDDILLTKALNAEMYSFGPLIPHPETPLAGVAPADINTVLKMLAVSRLADPDAKILVTTSLETLNENGRSLGLMAGANSLMINVTPSKCRMLYSIYPDRAGNNKEVEENIKETLQLLYSLGRAPTDLGI